MGKNHNGYWTDGTISFKRNNGLFLSDGQGDLNMQFEKEEVSKYEKFNCINNAIVSAWDGEATLNSTPYGNLVFEENPTYWIFDSVEL